MFQNGPRYRKLKPPKRAAGLLMNGMFSDHHNNMSGAARFGIQRNSWRRKNTLSCKQKYSPMKIGICAKINMQPPSWALWLIPALRNSFDFSCDNVMKSSLYFSLSLSVSGFNFRIFACMCALIIC